MSRELAAPLPNYWEYTRLDSDGPNIESERKWGGKFISISLKRGVRGIFSHITQNRRNVWSGTSKSSTQSKAATYYDAKQIVELICGYETVGLDKHERHHSVVALLDTGCEDGNLITSWFVKDVILSGAEDLFYQYKEYSEEEKTPILGYDGRPSGVFKVGEYNMRWQLPKPKRVWLPQPTWDIKFFVTDAPESAWPVVIGVQELALRRIDPIPRKHQTMRQPNYIFNSNEAPRVHVFPRRNHQKSKPSKYSTLYWMRYVPYLIPYVVEPDIEKAHDDHDKRREDNAKKKEQLKAKQRKTKAEEKEKKEASEGQGK
jgi:hypothetical protein